MAFSMLLCLLLVAISCQAKELYHVVVESLTDDQRRVYEHQSSHVAAMKSALIRVDIEGLRNTETDLTVLLFSGETVSFNRTRLDTRTTGFSWFGRDSRDDSTYAIFAASTEIGNTDLFGTIRTENQFYSIKGLGNGLAVLIQFNEHKFPEELEPQMVEKEEEEVSIVTANKRQGGDTFISVIIAYTPEAQSEVGNIVVLLQLAIDETNEGYRASNVGLVLNATRVYETDYTESASYSTDLTRFRTKNDGYMDEVHGFRNADRANMAHLIVAEGGSCGVASTIMATTTTAFCLTAQNCATGYYTFGHEMGHLQGARHDPDTDGSTNPFRYGHGYIIRSRFYRTIMAYDQNGETRVLHWSNPDVDFDGSPSGEPVECDNARVLDETATTVAGWCATGSCA